MGTVTKKYLILGGGTVNWVRAHMALSSPAYGNTARIINQILLRRRVKENDINLQLTRMANEGRGGLETNDDVKRVIDNQLKQFSNNDEYTNVVFMSCAMCDADGHIGDDGVNGKHGMRIRSRELNGIKIKLTMAEKVLKIVRKDRERKGNFLIAFKATNGESSNEQYKQGLEMMKESSANLVLANDTLTKHGMIIVPEEARYGEGLSRMALLEMLVDMAMLRSGLTFTKTVMANEHRMERELIDFNSVPLPLRQIVTWLIKSGAYKSVSKEKGRDGTAGHFAYLPESRNGGNDIKTIITTIRGSNFNGLLTGTTKMVKIITGNDDDNTVLAFGAKPSVGGVSQKILFDTWADRGFTNIVHFHCPVRVEKNEETNINIQSQKPFECGSHECGENTRDGLELIEDLDDKAAAVMLDNHGPNILFRDDVNVAGLWKWIEQHFDLSDKTGGVVV